MAKRNNPERPEYRRKRKRSGFRAFVVFCSVIVLITVGCVALVRTYIKPPEAQKLPDGVSPTVPAPAGENDTNGATDILRNGEAPEIAAEDRKSDVFTMVIGGVDFDNTRTDTIMILNMNTKTKELSVLSIPRDTRALMANGNVHKINAAHNKGIDRMITELKNTVGFTVDRHLIINYEVFVELVEAIGGVEIDVPMDMHYISYDEDFVIDLKQGLQRLNGHEALQFVRFRTGYGDQDLGRVRAQQQFLGAVAKQFMKPSSLFLIPKILDILKENVETDLTTGEMIWLASALLGMNADNLRVDMLPGKAVGADYVANYDATLELVNEYYNPYIKPIKRLLLP